MLMRKLLIFVFAATLSQLRSSFVKENCAIQPIDWFVSDYGKEHFYQKLIGFNCKINKKDSMFTFDIENDKSTIEGLRDPKMMKFLCLSRLSVRSIGIYQYQL